MGDGKLTDGNELRNEVLDVYNDATAATSKLLAELRSENEQNDDDVKEAVNDLIGEIEMKNNEFKDAVEALSRDSEFEKFTVAFF